MSKPDHIPTETRIADGVLRVISDDGFDVVSVRTVAVACNVSPGTVQYYFPTRQALLTAALKRSFERQQMAVLTNVDGPISFSDLVAILKQLLPIENALREDAVAWVSFVAAAGTRPWLADIVTEALLTLQELISRQIADPQSELKLVRPHTPDQAARLITALFNGLTLDIIAVPANAEHGADDLERGLALILKRE